MITSLTPNEDAVLASQARVLQEKLAACILPGQAGVEARMVVALCDALNLAVARELDRASDATHIVHGSTSAVANLLITTGAMVGIPGVQILGEVVHKLGIIAGGEGRMISTEPMAAIPVPRA